MSDKQHTVRVRVSDKKGFLNLKSKSSNMSRDEYEYEIPLQDGLDILRSFTTSGTEKTRYNIPFEGKLWEVDEFLGDNTGLIVAEIELESEDEHLQNQPGLRLKLPMMAGTPMPPWQSIRLRIGKSIKNAL